jgi:hypothetical protein
VQREYGSPRPRHGWTPEDPTVALLSSDTDDPAGWLAAGMALSRLLLVATCAGLSASLLNQAVDLPGSRTMLARVTRTSGYPQALLRLGYPRQPGPPPTGRRPVDDILDLPAGLVSGSPARPAVAARPAGTWTASAEAPCVT